jgi:Icc protein
VISIHHPPRIDPASTHSWASLTPETTDALAEAIAGSCVLAILSGHIHINRVALWQGVPVVTTMGQQSTVDLTRPSGLSIIEGTGFAICDYLSNALQITHVPLATCK